MDPDLLHPPRGHWCLHILELKLGLHWIPSPRWGGIGRGEENVRNDHRFPPPRRGEGVAADLSRPTWNYWISKRVFVFRVQEMCRYQSPLGGSSDSEGRAAAISASAFSLPLHFAYQILSAHAKSVTQGPMGCCRQNFRPQGCFARRMLHCKP